MASTRKKRSASVGAPPAYASSMQEKLQHNASFVQIEKPKKNLPSQNRHSLQPKSTPSSQTHNTRTENSSTPTTTTASTNSSLQKELQIQLENDLPPQLLLQMQMQTLLRPYLQLRPHSPPDFISSDPSSSSSLPSSISSNPSDGDGNDESREKSESDGSQPASEDNKNNENNLKQETSSDISDVLQSYSKAYTMDTNKVPSLLSRSTPKKTHKDVDLTFRPRIDEKSQKMTASRHLLDTRSRAHILHDMDKEISQHKDAMRRTQADHLMKPYTFTPQLIDSSPKTDREVVDRLHHWYKERDDKIERLRLDNQVLQITNDMDQCTFSPTTYGYRGYGYSPAPSPGVDKFIERHARARQDKEEKEAPYIPGENWTPKLTQPKEFNFMVRERVKELLHEPSGSNPSSPSPYSSHSSYSHSPYPHHSSTSRSHSLPASPTLRHHSRHSREFSYPSRQNQHQQYQPSSTSPPTSPHSFPSSVSDLDAPLRETDTRSSADFEQLRYYLSDYAVQHPAPPTHTINPPLSSSSSSFVQENSSIADSQSDYTQNSSYIDDNASDNNSSSILYYNDNDKQFPPSTPNTRSRSNSHNISPQNNSYISQKSNHSLALSSPPAPAVYSIPEEEEGEIEEREEERASDAGSINEKREEIQKPMPRFQKFSSHLNSYGRPNSAPPSLHNAPESLLRHSGSLTRKHVVPTSQQRHQQLLQRIQQQQVQQHQLLQQQQQQQQQQNQIQQQQLQQQNNSNGYDPFFPPSNSNNQEFHYPLQPQLFSPSTPSSPFPQYP